MNREPHKASRRGRWKKLGRIGFLVSGTLAIIISLLTFPNAVPWMIAFWLLCHAVAVRKHRPGWLPLALCVTILIIKRPYWSYSLIVLAIFLVVVAAVNLLAARKAQAERPGPFVHDAELRATLAAPKKSRSGRAGAGPLVRAAMLWIAWLAFTMHSHYAARGALPMTLNPTRPVVCIGDSLTSGVRPYGGYPADLQQLLSVPVVNLGQPGITAEDALDLLPELVAAEPQAVVIELGGHDFLRGRDRAATRAHLQRIIAASKEAGAAVVLMEIPRGFMIDPYDGLERELAAASDLELIPDTAIRMLVLHSPHAPPGMWSRGPHLSDDGLHPNAHGNQHLARYVTDALRRLFGQRILR